MNNFKISIIGYGYVGRAYHLMFKDALIYDPFVKDIQTASKEEINQTDLAIICVPTPTAEDGKSCDTSIVEDTFKWLKTPLVLIKSTVRPGTTEKLARSYGHGDVCFSPEYVGEGNYFMPFWKYPHPNDPTLHDFMIVGGEKEATEKMVDIFESLRGPHIRYFQTDAKTAEVIKYMENMFIATKVTFVNEMYEVCKSIGVDWHTVREGWLLDSRVDRNFTAVRLNKRGYEGKCLPKDTKALISTSEESGYDPKFLKSVTENNNRIRKMTGFSEI